MKIILATLLTLTTMGCTSAYRGSSSADYDRPRTTPAISAGMSHEDVQREMNSAYPPFFPQSVTKNEDGTMTVWKQSKSHADIHMEALSEAVGEVYIPPTVFIAVHERNGFVTDVTSTKLNSSDGE